MAPRTPHPAVVPAAALLCVGAIAAVLLSAREDANEPQAYQWEARTADTGVNGRAVVPGTVPPSPSLPSAIELPGGDTLPADSTAPDGSAAGASTGPQTLVPTSPGSKSPATSTSPSTSPNAGAPGSPTPGSSTPRPSAPGAITPQAPAPTSTPAAAPAAPPAMPPATAAVTSKPAPAPVAVQNRAAQPAAQGSCPASSAWRLHLDERFNTLNPKVWNVKHNTSADNEHSYLRSGNVSVGGGRLRIQAKKESRGGRNYTSGYVETIGKYTVPTHFRAEVRAKVPMEQGMWAAPLWFRPADGRAGEIDLVETYGKDAEAGKPRFVQTIHTEYGSTHKHKGHSKLYSVLPNPSATAWHTYTMEKTPGRITMYVDCVKTAVFAAGDPSWYSKYYDVGDRWNLRVNLQVGGSWGGLPDSRTNWAADRTAMQIDHIRTWIPAG